MKDKKELNESIDKIKFMMGYDSSKTLFENEINEQELSQEQERASRKEIEKNVKKIRDHLEGTFWKVDSEDQLKVYEILKPYI